MEVDHLVQCLEADLVLLTLNLNCLTCLCSLLRQEDGIQERIPRRQFYLLVTAHVSSSVMFHCHYFTVIVVTIVDLVNPAGAIPNGEMDHSDLLHFLDRRYLAPKVTGAIVGMVQIGLPMLIKGHLANDLDLYAAEGRHNDLYLQRTYKLACFSAAARPVCQRQIPIKLKSTFDTLSD